MERSSTLAIAMHGLRKEYGRRVAVAGLDLTVESGEIFGFLGPNGAGKSTTIKMLVGLVHPTAGTATVYGYDVQRQTTLARQHLGYLPEGVALYGRFTALQMLRYAARFYGIASEPHLEQSLARVGLADVAREPIATFSKGMRQRLGLAIALVHDPPVLLLDEPLTGLDPLGVRTMRDLIRDLAHAHTIFLASHNLYEVEQLCERVAILNRGRLVVCDRVSKLLHGHRITLVARLTHVPDGLVDAVAGLPQVQTVQADHSELYIRVRDEMDRPAVVTKLVELGASIYEVRTSLTSLDDVFSQLLQGEAVDRRN
jgi:ABC-2 type transport system ATP-binding protein